MKFSPEALAQMRTMLDLPNDADGTAVLAAVSRRLDELAEDPPAPSPPRAQAVAPAQQPDTVVWGLATGRYSAPRAAFWDRRADDERRRTGSTAQTDAEIQSLAPVYEPPVTAVRDPGSGQFMVASARPSASPDEELPLTRALDRALFGPTPEDRERQDAIATEAALAEQLELEQAAEPDLTADERRAIFGPDSQG